VITEAPVIAAAGNDLALKGVIALQNSSRARAALTLLGGYHLYNFASDPEYRGQTISVDGGTGFSSVYFAADDIFSAGGSLWNSLRRSLGPTHNPLNYRLVSNGVGTMGGGIEIKYVGPNPVPISKSGPLFSPEMVDDYLDQAIAAIPANERLFLIGEDQFRRVNPMARKIGAKTATDFWPDNMIFPRPLNEEQIAASVEFNKYLIERLHKAGFGFGDIGPMGIEITSPWYQAELQTLETLGAHTWPVW
jgi:hypothetical protein